MEIKNKNFRMNIQEKRKNERRDKEWKKEQKKKKSLEERNY